MPQHYILQIETATPVCSVALSADGETVAYRDLDEANVHASRLTLLIEEVLRESAVTLEDLSAVAVSKGPGSYTGLRIGVSTAKGLCYAADLPLIGVDTLKGMAQGFKATDAYLMDGYSRLCPMIDARRMEVYMCIYDPKLQCIAPVSATIIDAKSFNTLLSVDQIVLFGSGADKLKVLFAGSGDITVVPGFKNSARYLSKEAFRAFSVGEFADVAYFEPYYLKDFVATTPKPSA